jgi:hypothetical protein
VRSSARAVVEPFFATIKQKLDLFCFIEALKGFRWKLILLNLYNFFFALIKTFCSIAAICGIKDHVRHILAPGLVARKFLACGDPEHSPIRK